MKVETKSLSGLIGDTAVWRSVLLWMMAVGLFIQISGYVWFESGSARNAQVYLWLLVPALAYGLGLLVSGRVSWPGWHYYPWLLLLLWVGLSALWGSSEEPWSLAKRGFAIAAFFLAVHCLLDLDDRFLRMALLFGVAGVALGALASLLYQFAWLEKPLAYRAFRIDRLGIGDFANYDWPVVAGIFHGAVASWALGVVVDKRTSLRAAAFWLLVFAVLALYVLLTYTRGAWFGMLGSAFAVVLMQRSRRGWWLLGLGLLCMAVAVFLWWDRLLFEVQTRQLSGRELIWDHFVAVMPGHWLFGYGLGTPFSFVWPDGRSIIFHAHSLFLQLVYDSGLVALGLMAAGLLVVAHKVWKLRDDPWVRLAFPALVFALIAMLTDVERIFTRPGVYWTVFWLPLAILLAVPARRGKLAGDR
ncbi:O-antigen ligase family protein [Zestomonas carbonaria]|uniref:O-antigen ligase-related domain-containing protein n=1 Tax=Zestomonas carbonaria TaxID=2762745 RepID=A0A7U7IAY4_9GAMM|nr:O-antigen ligase family protein [Pseudomonas carbonaria]CAD5109721.1 hypothetical protein PSEWESI4_04027 [Pseudomonas carbonaria]